MTNAWEDWEDIPAECTCGWAGKLGEATADLDSLSVTVIDCPQCSKRLTVISNHASEEMISEIASEGGKRAQEHLSSQEKRRRVRTELHNLGLETLISVTSKHPPVVEGYETIPESEFSTHPGLKGISSWIEDFSPEDDVYAGYSIPVHSEIEEEEIARIAFIYFDAKTFTWVEKPGNIATFSNGRRATWYSENSEQTKTSRPPVPVAILLKKESLAAKPIQIYSFTIQDKDPECLTFGCTASSLEEAQAKARKAGYREFLLMDVRDPSGVELSDVANLELISNPLLGNEWLPLVSALEAATTNIPVGASWSMDFMGKAYGYQTSDSPYTQAVVEGDGSLHLEIGPTDMVEGRTEDQKQLLSFLGWEAPREGLPNYFRIFEPGWNPRYVANVFLQTVSLIFEISTEDLFTFSGTRVKVFDPDGLMDHLSDKNGRLAFGDAWGFWGKHPFSPEAVEDKDMSDSRLQELINELFVSDPRAKEIMGGEILESFDMDIASAALNEGKPIPASAYTMFDGFVRQLKADPERTTRLQNFDVYLTATLARLMDTRDTFFTALWRADSAGGPYISFVKKADKYEVTLMSNYRKLEKREQWFAAALSLFEWYAADTGFLGVKLYRKSWSLDNDPVEIASAISLAVTYVLDGLASECALIQIPRLQDEIFEGEYRKGQLNPVVDDASMGWRLIKEANSNGFYPPVSQYRAGMDSLISQHNLRDAIDIAAENDDELGMYSLEQLLEDVQKREALFKPIPDKIREFISLSTHIPSIRQLPRDHPAYEELEDEEQYGEDFDDDIDEYLAQQNATTPLPQPSADIQPAKDQDIPKSSKVEEFDEYDDEEFAFDDAPTISEGNSATLWSLLNTFEGKVKVTSENSHHREFLLATLFGSYLKDITGFEKLHDVRFFAPAFEAREKKQGPPLAMLIDGGPLPTVLNSAGIYDGVIARFQDRAAKVFETLLELKSIDDHNSRLIFINALSDERLMDCLIWSMVKNKGTVRSELHRSVESLITRLGSMPRM